MAAGLLAAAAANQERARQAAEEAEFKRHLGEVPSPYTRIPASPRPLGTLKVHQEHLETRLERLRSRAALMRHRATLRKKIVHDVADIRRAYDGGDLYESLRVGSRLKRHVHRWRIATEAMSTQLPLPSRASQWHGLSSDGPFRDVPAADELRAWAEDTAAFFNSWKAEATAPAEPTTPAA